MKFTFLMTEITCDTFPLSPAGNVTEGEMESVSVNPRCSSTSLEEKLLHHLNLPERSWFSAAAERAALLHNAEERMEVKFIYCTKHLSAGDTTKGFTVKTKSNRDSNNYNF